MLKTKIVTAKTTGGFERAMDKLLNEIGPGSVQYRPTSTGNGTLWHTALVIHEVPDELEGDKADD